MGCLGSPCLGSNGLYDLCGSGFKLRSIFLVSQKDRDVYKDSSTSTLTMALLYILLTVTDVGFTIGCLRIRPLGLRPEAR